MCVHLCTQASVSSRKGPTQNTPLQWKVETSQQATVSTQHTRRRYLKAAVMKLMCKAQNKQPNLCLYLVSQSQLRITYKVGCPEKLQNVLKKSKCLAFSPVLPGKIKKSRRNSFVHMYLFSRLPREIVDASSLAVFKTRLDGALSNLV